ncbi:MAG: DUF2306 domain-containing protein [Cyclobacteriaceae bacterium]
MMRRFGWWIFGILSVSIGLYPIIYFLIERTFGLLSSKSETLLNDGLWNTAFYTHIVLGGLALLVGWTQFNDRVRLSRPALHRTIGKVYVLAVMASGFSGLYIAMFATGGLISILGFASLAIIWLSSTLQSFMAIVRERNVIKHQRLMVYSYAATFAAVTLRIWLPILIGIFGEFLPAYQMVAWMCWVPNLAVAYLIVRKMDFSKTIIAKTA